MLPFGEFDIWLTRQVAELLARLSDAIIEILVGISYPLAYLAIAFGMLSLIWSRKLGGRIILTASLAYLFIQLLPGIVAVIRAAP